MDAVTQINVPGIGHNAPPLDLRDALEPRALAIMVANELVPHTAAAAGLLAEYQRFVLATEGGIITEAADCSAVDFAEEIKTELANLDATRTTIKAPVLLAQKAIDGAAKAIGDPLIAARAEVQRRHTTFLCAKDAEIRRQAAEAAAHAEETARLLAQEAEGTRDAVLFAEVAVARAEQRAAEDMQFAPIRETTRMRTATGNLSGLKDDWKYAVTDISEVPAHMLQVCDAIVKATIKSGTRSVPGLRIYNDPRAR